MNSSPKKLNLDEMWQVYKLIGDSVSNPIHEKLIDELIEILRKSSRLDIFRVLRIFRYNVIENIDSTTMAIYFTNGIKENKFLDFVRQIRMF